MESFREIISKQLRFNREKISDSSIKTYASMLSSINKKLGGEKDLEFFSKDTDKIINFIKENITSFQTQKTLLSALYILTDLKEYKDFMLEICKKVNDNYKEQKMNDKQKEHRISFQEVQDKVNSLLSIIKTNPSLNSYELFLIAAFSSGVYAPPRRSEFAFVKIKNFDRRTDNYLEKNKIVFNSYKTAKKYGSQIYEVPSPVIPILKKYLRLNKTDYLFPKRNGNECMTNVDYNRTLQKIFGKTISVDNLRSIYLSEKYKNIPSLVDMEATATAMGHQIVTSLENYVRKE
jgi:integrase